MYDGYVERRFGARFIEANRTPTRKLRARMRHASHVKRWTRYWKKRHRCYRYCKTTAVAQLSRVSRYGAYCETCFVHLLRS